MGEISSGRQIPEALFYVWAFETQAADYVPLAVFNTDEEARRHIAELQSWAANNKVGHKIVENPLQLTWGAFCAMAQDTKVAK